MEYLQSCRMANAKQLLAETEFCIGEIVEKCGFCDNSNFSRTFKKLNGLSPSDFRKKYKAE
jgi:YesN/AraC family two-component response regulator